MKRAKGAGLGYATMVALVAGAMAVSATPASAGNAYGRDNNPGNANGHAKNGGPTANSNGNGSLASAMGSLNSAHASANGLANASPNSRPGMLAAYMDAMVVYEAEYELVDWAAHEALMTEYGTLQAEADALYDEYETLLAAEDPTAPDKLAEYEAKQAEADAKLAEANALTAAVDAAATGAAGHLQDAANKDGLIDSTVVHEVNTLLEGKSDDFNHLDDPSNPVHGSEGDIADIINPPE